MYYQNCVETLIYVHKLLRTFDAKDKVCVVTVRSLNTRVLSGLCLSDLTDINAVVVISLSLALKLRLTSGTWILAKFSSRWSSHYRWTRVLVSPRLKTDGVCYLHQLLLHNVTEVLGSEAVTLTLKTRLFIRNVYLVTRLFSALHSKEGLNHVISKYKTSLVPPFALEVELKVMELSHGNVDASLEDLLRHHFQIPRYVSDGDVLAVPSIHPVSVDNYQTAIPPAYFYFKVASLRIEEKTAPHSGCLVSRDSTTLFLSGSTCHKVPSLDRTIQTLSSSVPPCLIEPFVELCRLFQLFLLANRGNDCGPMILLIGPSGRGKIKLINLLWAKYGYQIKWVDSWSVKGDTSASTEAKIKRAFSKILPYSILVFTNVGVLCEDREGVADHRAFAAFQNEVKKLVSLKEQRPFIIGTVANSSEVSDDMWSLFTYHLTLSSPSQESRKVTLMWLWDALSGGHVAGAGLREEQFQLPSYRTAGFDYRDLEELTTRFYRKSVTKRSQNDDKGITEGKAGWCSEQELLLVLDEMQMERSEALGLPKIPRVKWKEVGGLEDAKRELINTILLPIKHPDLVSRLIRRSGVLLHGPPGTGKTMLAKSVASECGLNFLSVKGPELLNMYVGQSEENVRQVFQKARNAAPCVIFFDELDSLAPNRGRSGDSGGVMDRIVSSLLAELDGVASSSDVFVLGATNRPDLLDPALLRPGRFEKQMYIGICESHTEQLKILKAVTDKIRLHEAVSLEKIVKELPCTLTGADFLALATDAFYIAVRRIIGDTETGTTSEDGSVVLVTEDDLVLAAQQLVPSVSPAELALYKETGKSR